MNKNKPINHWLFNPDYDYYENLDKGPFGEAQNSPVYVNKGKPKFDFFGTPVYSPFGIAAGPLPRAHHVRSALDRGYDIVTFKTVRSNKYPVHPAPNVLFLNYKKFNPNDSDQTYKTSNDFRPPLTIANSFGIPSFEPEIWQKEICESFKAVKKGRALLVAFQGTLQPQGRKEFIDDHVYGVGKLRETGAKLIELNLSCPNEGHSNLLCFDIKTSKEIVKRVKSAYPDLSLIVKISYFNDDLHLGNFVKELSPYIVGITAFNTLPANIVDIKGKQAFSGKKSRIRAGVSGEAVKYLCVEMAERLRHHRKQLNADFKIIGVGGVQTPDDFHNLRNAGADYVMGLTGVMWNPNLAAEIKATL